MGIYINRKVLGMIKKIFVILLLTVFSVFTLTAANNWYAKHLPPNLIKSSGKRVNTAGALHGKMVLLYFSASGCGPCREFTPHLVEFYKKAAKKNNIEIVFVSSDKDSADMMDYMKKDSMPWLAIPYESSKRMALDKTLQVRGIPKLIVFDANGKVMSPNARWDVRMLGTKAVAAWKLPNYKPLTYDDYLKKQESSSKNSKKSKNKNKRSK